MNDLSNGTFKNCDVRHANKTKNKTTNDRKLQEEQRYYILSVSMAIYNYNTFFLYTISVLMATVKLCSQGITAPCFTKTELPTTHSG